MAEAFFKFLIEKLGSLLLSEIGSIRGVGKEMNKLSNTLTTIQKVLEDAEDKQFQSKSIQNWVSKLHEIAFEIEDVLDECATEAFKLKRKAGKFNLNKYYSKFKIARRIKEAGEKLDALAEDRHRFHLQEIVVQQPNQVGCRRETGSVLNEPDHVYGRDEEKEKIVDTLVKEVKDCANLSVLPIIGGGGLGKTTLAQYVYNDERVTQHFQTKLWVCVSDDFDFKAILKAIIESVAGDKPNLENLDSLQQRVRQQLKEKRYLLILDDVWNDNQENWVNLKSVLTCGAIGASIIVTTRQKNVADIMGTLPAHSLTLLSLEHCWLLFKLRAFGQQEDERHLSLETVGRRIVKKCAGVPLAAKALGGLLRFKREEKEWIRVEESHIWNLPEERNSILPVLRLSYRHLPVVLKRCFAYCAIFPKDYVFDKQELIFHWMAHGCIFSNGNEDAEDVGDQIWNELALRSFFQQIYEGVGKTSFKMHDLVHDLAQFIMESRTSGAETKLSGASASDRKIRQVQWRNCPKVSTSSIAMEVSSLTTIMNFNRLRTLKLNRATVQVLPSVIVKLKHLRHLDLSNSSIRTLPPTFYCLCNLQILNLNYCNYLESLPESITYMTNLRHIFLENCNKFSCMPYRIRNLTSLKTLSVFVVSVGDKIGYRLDEMEHLNLGGMLEIRHLERAQDHTNAKKANLVEKPNLRELVFYWKRLDETCSLENMMDDEELLENLQPHPNLATLEIMGFRGRKWTFWMKNMKNLTKIDISYCANCTRLPPFGDLLLLKYLILKCLDAVEYIVEKDDFGCQNSLEVKFPSLEYLRLRSLPNLKGLFEEEQVGGEMFPNLQTLTILGCPLMIQTSTSFSTTIKNLKHVTCSPFILPSLSSKLENLTSLDLDFGETRDTTIINIPEDAPQGLCNIKTLSVHHATEFRSFPEKWSRCLNSVTKLNLCHCRMRGCFPKGWTRHLTSLQGLDIWRCWEIVEFEEEFKHLHFLKHLSLECCDDMISLPQGLQQILSLQSLSLHHLDLTSLPDWLANLASLESLIITHCPKIASLPSSIQGMTTLTYLRISVCPELERRCEKAKGEDWCKISHIPRLHI